ncbi:MAG TPA: cyclase family protein [Gaiellaceae bacterium]|nr:cyclase family protein [Gaiellaceae bacterium]
MCDPIEATPGTGWRGWNASAAPRAPTATGDWIDLTWPLSPGVPRLSSFPPPRIERIASIPEDPLNVTELSMVVHVGTHVDSPRHFFSDGPALEDVPLERLMGPGVVWSVDKPLESLVEPEDLARMRPELEPGDILVLDTGIAEHVGTRQYERHVALSVAAAEWLVDKRIKLLAVDMPTPDIPLHLRVEGFDWPVHHVLLRDGVLISEQVANARQLAGSRAELLFLPLNVVGGDGAPARVLARAVET